MGGESGVVKREAGVADDGGNAADRGKARVEERGGRRPRDDVQDGGGGDVRRTGQRWGGSRGRAWESKPK